MVACHMGRTGNLTFRESLSDLSLEINPLRPDPARDSTRAFLFNPNRMPCFQPRNNKESSPDAVTPMDSSQKSTGIRAGYDCKYGPSCFGCQLGLEGMEARDEAFRLTPFQMPCWEPPDK